MELNPVSSEMCEQKPIRIIFHFCLSTIYITITIEFDF